MKRITSFFVRKQPDGQKKKLVTFENLVIIVVVGVIIILAGGFLTKPDGSKDVMKDQGTGQIPRSSLSDSEVVYSGAEVVADIERRLSELLSLVEGAGQVSVMIYADSSSELIPAYNDALDNRINQESDRSSTESSERRELALSGDSTPVILKVVIPEIKGVVVVAEGADDLLVRQELNNAVCTLLGVPEHRVQILKHK